MIFFQNTYLSNFSTFLVWG